MDLSLDFNHELYPLKPADNITVVLASSLSLAATTGEDRERETWRPDGRNDRGLDADYEYVMYGKVHFFSEPNLSCAEVSRSATDLQVRRRSTRQSVSTAICAKVLYFDLRVDVAPHTPLLEDCSWL